MKKSSRTYGTLSLTDGKWHLKCDPHVTIFVKRVFRRIPINASGVFRLDNTTAICRDLEWLTSRFPLAIENPRELKAGSKQHRDNIARLDQLIDTKYKPRNFDLEIPPRDYQRRAAEILLARKSLLIADDVGLGKTATAICALVDRQTLPAVVVTLAHLPRQWERELNRFAPDLFSHVIKKKTPYELPKYFGKGPDVLITNYHKLDGWGDILSNYCKTIVFDEIHELRHEDSQKYRAAKLIADECEFRCGLSATPIFGYGGEIFNVMNILAPGHLGSNAEFLREWCNHQWQHDKLEDPEAFGSFLKDEYLMIRRTRKDVGRELPGLTKITHTVASDTKVLDKISGQAAELARIILADTEAKQGDKMHATGMLDVLIRQQTGIAKAPYVADFVRMLIENGEPVVLYGWHRAVYEIWKDKLADLNPAFYTGHESPAQKQAAVDRFVSGETNLFIISVRSGAGLDGLQKRCRTVVHGELDWSPAVHQQNIGRVNRDGQTDPVIAYFLVSEFGSDPLMAEVLGIKAEQVEGVLADEQREILQRVDDGQAIRKLAEQYLSKVRKHAG